MPRSSALNLPQPDEIAPFEVAISVLEFPQSSFRVGCVKNIAYYVVSALELARIRAERRSNLCEIRTC